MAEIPVRVQCNPSEPTYTPICFRLNNRELPVKQILDQWWGEGATYFKVRASDENLYILKHKEAVNRWTLDLLAPQKVFRVGHSS